MALMFPLREVRRGRLANRVGLILYLVLLMVLAVAVLEGIRNLPVA